MTTALLGSFGAWLNPVYDDDTRVRFAAEAEKLGYGTVWLGLGQRDESDLALVERVLDATQHVTVATAIINMWTNEPARLAASYVRLQARHPDRILLGVGIGHPESIGQFSTPYERMTSFLDVLDHEGVPAGAWILAALGPRALRLAAARSAGTHPYLTVPEHTRQARRILGATALLAPEQTVVVDDDATRARTTGRDFLATPYLQLSNYTRTMQQYGFDQADVAHRGSDRLIDALAPHGTVETIARTLRRHLDAGADHVGVQVLPTDDEGPMPGLRRLAPALLS